MLGLVLVVGTIGLLIGGTLRGLLTYHLTIKEIQDSLEELKAADDFKKAVGDLSRPRPEPEKNSDPARPASAFPRRPRSNDPIRDATIHERITVCQTKLTAYGSQLQEGEDHSGKSEYTEHQAGTVKKLRGFLEALKEAEDVLLTQQLRVVGADDQDPAEEPVRTQIAMIERTAADLHGEIHKIL